jgi:hypothetical protein
MNLPWTLDPTLVLNAGIVHRGTPLPDFPIFAPYMLFLANFSPKLEFTTLLLHRGAYFGNSLNRKGKLEIRGGGPPITQ